MRTKPALVFLAIVVVVFAWSAIGLVEKAMETAKNKNIAANKVADLQQQKEKLASDIGKLNTDRGIEESIREKFGWAKEGEKMIMVMDDKNPPAIDENAGKKDFFSFFKNLFK